MQTVGLAFASEEGKGRKIHIPFRQVAEIVNFRTGDLAVLAGAPGGGKSLTAVNWAWRSHDPVLYVAQEKPSSILKRFIALALSEKTSNIVEEDRQYWSDRILSTGQREELTIAKGEHTIDMIEAKITALTEWLMEPPSLIIIDNLGNLTSDEGVNTDVAFYGDVLPKLKNMAYEKDVGILLLHHVTRSGEKGKKHGQGIKPLTMTDLLFGGEREAHHVWSVYRGWNDRTINFQILKQTDGLSNPDGTMQIVLDWRADEGLLWDR